MLNKKSIIIISTIIGVILASMVIAISKKPKSTTNKENTDMYATYKDAITAILPLSQENSGKSEKELLDIAIKKGLVTKDSLTEPIDNKSLALIIAETFNIMDTSGMTPFKDVIGLPKKYRQAIAGVYNEMIMIGQTDGDIMSYLFMPSEYVLKGDFDFIINSLKQWVENKEAYKQAMLSKYKGLTAKTEEEANEVKQKLAEEKEQNKKAEELAKNPTGKPEDYVNKKAGEKIENGKIVIPQERVKELSDGKSNVLTKEQAIKEVYKEELTAQQQQEKALEEKRKAVEELTEAGKKSAQEAATPTATIKDLAKCLSLTEKDAQELYNQMKKYETLADPVVLKKQGDYVYVPLACVGVAYFEDSNEYYIDIRVGDYKSYPQDEKNYINRVIDLYLKTIDMPDEQIKEIKDIVFENKPGVDIRDKQFSTPKIKYGNFSAREREACVVFNKK